jgi:hypothetical protein
LSADPGDMRKITDDLVSDSMHLFIR